MDECRLTIDSILEIVKYVSLHEFKAILFSCREVYYGIINAKIDSSRQDLFESGTPYTDYICEIRKVLASVESLNHSRWKLKFAKITTYEDHNLADKNIEIRQIGYVCNGWKQGLFIEVCGKLVPKDRNNYYDRNSMQIVTGIKSISYYIDNKKYGLHYEYVIASNSRWVKYLAYTARYIDNYLDGIIIVYIKHVEDASYISNISTYRQNNRHGVSLLMLNDGNGHRVMLKSMYNDNILIESINKMINGIPIRDISIYPDCKYIVDGCYRGIGTYFYTPGLYVYKHNKSHVYNWNSSIYSFRVSGTGYKARYNTDSLYNKYTEIYNSVHILVGISIVKGSDNIKYKVNK